MEDKKSTMMSCRCRGREVSDDEDCVGTLPGFRFHPTDEELVGFYLKRKVEKRPLHTIEMIIKHIDIYKHDPWDLAKTSSSMGDKEWYFYCKRGRKYRNSIRPNRVTGSGFWKATGIDRPIYSNGGESHHCIGLKKSLVYYKGSAGKGTKTDWMMHEFRLPSDVQQHEIEGNPNPNPNPNPKDTTLEAEIWTLCRIFKRNKKHTPDWRQLSAKKNTIINTFSKTNNNSDNNNEHFISFTTNPKAPTTSSNNVSSIISDYNTTTIVNQQRSSNLNNMDHDHHEQQEWISMADQHTHHLPSSYSSSRNMATDEENDLQSFANFEQNSWDDLMSVMESVVRAPLT